MSQTSQQMKAEELSNVVHYGEMLLLTCLFLDAGSKACLREFLCGNGLWTVCILFGLVHQVGIFSVPVTMPKW